MRATPNTDIREIAPNRATMRMWRWPLTALITGLAIVAIVLVTAPAALELTGRSLVVVNGNSMGSAAPNGSVVITRSTDSESLRAGDIIVFEAPWAIVDGQPTNVVHRLELITTSSRGLLGYTAGDANNLPDPEPIRLGTDQRTVTAIIPHLGALLSPALNAAANATLLILMLAVAIAMITFRTSARPVNSKQIAYAIA